MNLHITMIPAPLSSNASYLRDYTLVCLNLHITKMIHLYITMMIHDICNSIFKTCSQENDSFFFLTFLTNMFKLKSSFNKDFMSSTNSFPQLVLYNRSTTFGGFFNQILLIVIHWVPGFISLLLGSILVHIWICII